MRKIRTTRAFVWHSLGGAFFLSLMGCKVAVVSLGAQGEPSTNGQKNDGGDLPGDAIQPVITVSTPVSMIVAGAKYGIFEALVGVTAHDDHDGDITSQLQVTGLPPTTAVAGTYALSYHVADAAGNSAEIKTRTLIIYPTSAPVAGAYYLAPNGNDNSGNGSYAKPWASASKAYAAMKGGDTLILKNGTYNRLAVLQVNSQQIYPPAGTAAAYTTIQAETFGLVVIDGQGAMSPIDMANVTAKPLQYVHFDGLIFRHQVEGAQVYGGNHLKFTRCGFEDAADGNSSTFILNKVSYGLVEECFAWGSGRYKFLIGGSDHIIVRRSVARIDRANPEGDPLAVFSTYDDSHVQVQNCVAIDSDQSHFWSNVGEYGGAFYIPSTNGLSDNVTITGSIALNVDMGFGSLTKSMDQISVNNSVGWHLREGALIRDPGVYNHITLGDVYGPALQTSTVGFDYWGGGGHPDNLLSITNSILFNIKGTALRSGEKAWSEDYNLFFGNTADKSNTTGGAHSAAANPQLQYILSAAGSSAAVVGKASDGEDLGATITMETGVTGTLWGDAGYNTITTTSLWPFPNETIIAQFMKSYSYTGAMTGGGTGTLSGDRGFAALYPEDAHPLTEYMWSWLGKASPY